MNSTAQGSATKGLFRLSVFVINNFSYFIVFPIAAWNHNLVLMVVSVLIPFMLGRAVAVLNGRSFTPAKKSPKGFLITALAGFLLWHHLWFFLIIFVIVAIVANTTITTTTKR
jgi:hypothetical protein